MKTPLLSAGMKGNGCVWAGSTSPGVFVLRDKCDKQERERAEKRFYQALVQHGKWIMWARLTE